MFTECQTPAKQKEDSCLATWVASEVRLLNWQGCKGWQGINGRAIVDIPVSDKNRLSMLDNISSIHFKNIEIKDIINVRIIQLECTLMVCLDSMIR